MPDPGGEDAAARDQELAALARSVRELAERVAALEQGSAPAAQAPSVPLPAPPPLASEVPREPARAPAAAPLGTPRAAWSAGRMAEVDRERLPVIIMGAAGGIALLMGTLYFAWYSIQQGWVSPEVRLSVTGLFGLAAMGVAWRLAPRGHRTVAASVGGAGLGAWFGAVLVARHSYAFLSPAATFALLVFGAGLGIWIATHRRLRFFATLAALAALVTPLTIGYYEDRLHERMAYQLVVVVFLYTIEQRRRWVELGTLAIFGTWVLLFSWVVDQEDLLGQGGVVGWSFVYLIAGHAQGWRLLDTGRISTLVATPRLWFNAYAAWFVASIVGHGNEVAYTALLMALVNAAAACAVFGPLVRSASTSSGHPFWRAACLSACTSVAWLQLFAFAPLRWESDAVLVWWCAMAVVIAVLHVRRPRYAYLLPLLLPGVGALLWSVEHDTTTSAVLGFTVAALPFLLALWPSRAEVEGRAVLFDLYLALHLGLGCLAWALMSLVHFGDRDPGAGWFMMLCLAAAVPSSLRVIAEPSRARSAMLLLGLAILVYCSVAFSVAGDLFDALGGFGTERLWQIGGLVGVAAIALNLGAHFKVTPQVDGTTLWPARVHDFAGILRPWALLVVAMLLVSGSVAAVTDEPGNARSINQAGWSVCWAIAGLSLLLRGLRRGRILWRGAGMLALFATGAKLLAVDLVHVSMIWRVLSFVGLGACLLLGAYAYRRLSPAQATPR